MHVDNVQLMGVVMTHEVPTCFMMLIFGNLGACSGRHEAYSSLANNDALQLLAWSGAEAMLHVMDGPAKSDMFCTSTVFSMRNQFAP